VGATDIESKLEHLRAWFVPLSGVVVAYSGGIDSTLVAAVAAQVLGDRVLAVTADSPSLPPGELPEARRVARLIGVRHRTVRTRETEKSEYLANGADRCYQCRTELYGVLAVLAEEAGGAVVISGTNVDDLGDYRPGLRAAEERGVRHPLVETGFSKADVREAARLLGLPIWSKPATACLSSRIAHGERITVGDLARSAPGRAGVSRACREGSTRPRVPVRHTRSGGIPFGQR
jgi:uncharacterized protein